jgi:hypothetical protein
MPVRDYGGHAYDVVRVETDSVASYRNFKLYSRITIVVKDDEGGIQRWRWLRGIAERKGAFKIYSTETESTMDGSARGPSGFRDRSRTCGNEPVPSAPRRQTTPSSPPAFAARWGLFPCARGAAVSPGDFARRSCRRNRAVIAARLTCACEGHSCAAPTSEDSLPMPPKRRPP